MRDTGLLQVALGVAPPWTVVGSDFDTAARRLDIYIDFTTGSRFTCPSCGAADCPAHDTEQVTWRHLNFFQHQAYLHVVCLGLDRGPHLGQRCDAASIRADT